MAAPTPYPRDSSTTTLRRALALLLEHTGRRVRDGVRSPHTLAMQEIHAAWMLRQIVPGSIFGGEDPMLLADVPVMAFTTPALVALLEHWHRAGGAGGRPLTLQTVAKRKSTLRRALHVLVERGELERVPQMPEIGLPPFRPRMRILRTYLDLQRLMRALPPRRAEWIAVAVWTCQRPGDTERMSWSDVDLRSTPATMLIRSTKTRRPHGIRVKVPAPLVAVLLARRSRLQTEGHPPAATDPLVDRWPGVSRVLPVTCVRLGLPPMSAMDLRHTGISWMVRRKGLTRAAQEWGGWSDFNMLSRHYAHALPAQLMEASDELASMADEATNDNQHGGTSDVGTSGDDRGDDGRGD